MVRSLFLTLRIRLVYKQGLCIEKSLTTTN